MANKDYMTDEELMNLISSVEEKEMIGAPKHLKSNILFEVKKMEEKKKVDITTYRIKIVLGMAASIFLFCVLPSVIPSSSGMERAKLSIEKREERYQEYVDEKEKEEELSGNITEKINEIRSFLQ